MPHVFTLPDPHGHHHYAHAYWLGLLVYSLLLVWNGWRQGVALRRWVPLVAAATLALVLGCRLVVQPLAQWPAVLLGQVAATPLDARSILGGATASFLVVLALRRPLGLSWRVFDAFVGPLCAGLAVQCAGCLLVGCCFGEVAAPGAAWALRYPAGTLPYLAQQARGLLAPGAAYALPTVPTQAYALLLCAGTGLALWALRRRAWPAGSRYLLGTGALLLGRALIEFGRDPLGEPLATDGLGVWQLASGLLVVAVLQLAAAGVLASGRAGALARYLAAVPPRPRLHPALLVAGLLAVAAAVPPALLNGPELTAVRALLLGAAALEGGWWLRQLLQPRVAPARAGASGWLAAWAAAPPLGLAAGVALLLFTAQTPASAPAQPDDEAEGRSLTFGGGALGGTYDEDVVQEVEKGCGGSGRIPNHTAYYHRYQAAGGEVAYTWQHRNDGSPSTVGAGVWAGTERVGVRYLAPNGLFEVGDPDRTLRRDLLDVHLFAEGQNLRLGGGLQYGYRGGLHLGQLGHPAEAKAADSVLRALGVLPEVMVWLGQRRTVFGQADVGYGPEKALGNYTGRFAVGSGLGQTQGSSVLLGLAFSRHEPSPTLGFVGATLRLPGGRTGLGGLSLEPYFATDFDRHRQLSLRLNYRLGLK